MRIYLLQSVRSLFIVIIVNLSRISHFENTRKTSYIDLRCNLCTNYEKQAKSN